MSRVKIDDFEKYEQLTNNTSKFEFFSLDNDGDSAVIRFMYEGLDEIEGVACHTVSVNGKDRKVACLREYGDPLGNCPFCEAKMNVSPRLFLEMKQYERTPDGRALTGEAKTVIWERGRSFIKKLTALAMNYNPLCDYFFIIVRSGKKGDTQTSYEIMEYRGDVSKVTDMSLPEEPYDPVGSLVWDKNHEEMKSFLNNGSFPMNDSNDGVVRRERPQEVPQPAPTYSAPQAASYALVGYSQPQTNYQATAPMSQQAPTQPSEPVRRRRI